MICHYYRIADANYPNAVQWHGVVLGDIQLGDPVTSAEKDSGGITVRWRKAEPGDEVHGKGLMYSGQVEAP